MHIGHILMTWSDMTLIWRPWPKFNFLMTWFDFKNLEFEFLTKFRCETYVYWIWYVYWFWTKFDLLMTWFVLKNLEFEFLTQFRYKTYVYWIYFDYLAIFDPNLTGLTKVWPLIDLIWPLRISNFNYRQNLESKHM